MAEPFDLIVIGTGAGGSAAAYRCKRKGWRVAVVEHHELVAGLTVGKIVRVSEQIGKTVAKLRFADTT